MPKILNAGLDNEKAIVRGWVGSLGAASNVLIGGITDGQTTTDPPNVLEFAGLTVEDLGDGITLVASSWKVPCRVATTTAGTLASSFENGDTIDGITLVTDDRVLIKDQAAPAENGIYVVNPSGAPTRSLDLGRDELVLGAVLYVVEGTVNQGTVYACTNTVEPILDTDAINFALVTGAEPVDTFLTTTEGGQALVVTTLTAGAAYAINCALGNVFDITLTANCTLTITNPPPLGVSGEITVILRQGGSGSYTVTWPASVDWQNPTTGLGGGSAPTLFTAVGAQNDIELSTLDAGVTWGGSSVPAGTFANPMTTRGDLIVENSTPAPARLALGTAGKFLTAGASDPSWGQGPLTTTGDLLIGATGGTPTRLAVGGANTVVHGGTTPAYSAVVEADLSFSNITTANATTSQHGLLPILPNDATKFLDGTGAYTVPPGSGAVPTIPVWNVTFNGDGATTVFELPAAPYDAYSVQVSVGTGVNTDWALSNAMLTTLTFGVAPTTGTNNVSVNIMAAVG